MQTNEMQLAKDMPRSKIMQQQLKETAKQFLVLRYLAMFEQQLEHNRGTHLPIDAFAVCGFAPLFNPATGRGSLQNKRDTLYVNVHDHTIQYVACLAHVPEGNSHMEFDVVDLLLEKQPGSIIDQMNKSPRVFDYTLSVDTGAGLLARIFATRRVEKPAIIQRMPSEQQNGDNTHDDQIEFELIM